MGDSVIGDTGGDVASEIMEKINQMR
jgi:hypothetical protein